MKPKDNFGAIATVFGASGQDSTLSMWCRQESCRQSSEMGKLGNEFDEVVPNVKSPMPKPKVLNAHFIAPVAPWCMRVRHVEDMDAICLVLPPSPADPVGVYRSAIPDAPHGGHLE